MKPKTITYNVVSMCDEDATPVKMPNGKLAARAGKAFATGFGPHQYDEALRLFEQLRADMIKHPEKHIMLVRFDAGVEIDPKTGEPV